jgi:FkbM family methyltransferase
MIKTLRNLLGCLMSSASLREDSVPEQQTHAGTAAFFECLRSLKFSPRIIVDVGANRGNWTRGAMLYFPDARYLLFEPQSDLLACTDLESNPNVQIFNVGAGPLTGIMRLSKHARDDSFSFALSPEEAIERGREQIDAQVVALDEFLPAQGVPAVCMLKVDAEGWDLEVLKGARGLAAAAQIILVEAAVMNSFFPNRIEQVIAEMDKLGFVLFDITDLNRTPKHGALWLVELAFVPRGGSLSREARVYAEIPAEG